MIIFDKFTNHYHNVIKRAYKHALDKRHAKVDFTHIIYGLITENGSIGGEMLKKSKITINLIEKILLTIPVNSSTKNRPSFDAEVVNVLKKSIIIAYELNHKYVGTEHLLSSLLQFEKINLIVKSKEKRKNLTTQIDNVLRSTSKFSELTQSFEDYDDDDYDLDDSDLQAHPSSKNISLHQFAVELTDAKAQQNIDPVIGREKELERVIHILCRRTKNNPVLLGEAGVGKTAIVEGLAKRIYNHEVPDALINKKIMSLDLASLVSGTMYRGEFENRLRQIIQEVTQNPNIILFIDELHNIIGAGSTSGSMDAANILKPALARGQIRCIGATTLDEYKKHIEKDPALDRRFQEILVEEPDTQKTIEIIHGIKNNYEKFHNIKISKEAIESAVHLSHRYIQEQQLPDKAIDLIDEASAKLSIKVNTTHLFKKIQTLENQLNTIKIDKQSALLSEDFSKAIHLQTSEKQILEELISLKQKHQNVLDKKNGLITKEHIIDVLSYKTGIPKKQLHLKNKKSLKNIEKKLKKAIVGQDHAITQVASHIKRSQIQLSSPHKPYGSFIFLGPSGVGKTEFAKQLAVNVFGNEKNLIRIDMSEFSESFNVSKLIGAPAGYVGYGEKNGFTDKIRKQPYSVVLFDEIEKAHPKIFNILLQILDEGYITDSVGKKIDFRNTIIIMTSNIGADAFGNKKDIGFDLNTKEGTMEFIHDHITSSLKQFLKPELINRIDRLIVFNKLSKQNIHAIAKKSIKDLEKRLQNHDVDLKLSKKALEYIITKSITADQGARGIRKVLEHEIEDLIAHSIIEETIKDNTIQLDVENGLLKVV